jgi:hypothetical protein
VNRCVLSTTETRDLVCTMGRLIDWVGLAGDHPTIITLKWQRDLYVARVRLPEYLSQMLGEVGPLSMRHCVLYWDDQIKPLDGRMVQDPDQAVQYFIRQHYELPSLPYKVVARLAPEIVQVRYL